MSTKHSEIPLSKSLQKFLTVTKESSPGVVTARPIPPSDLVAKLDAFLPELARANSALLANTPPVPDTIETVTAPSSRKADIKEHRTTLYRNNADGNPVADQSEHTSISTDAKVNEFPSERDGYQDDSHGASEDKHVTMIEMDLFVDNSLGHLVPSGDISERRPEHSLVREVGELSSEQKSLSHEYD